MELKLRYRAPAEDSAKGWEEQSLPIGCGYIGANVFGIVERETVTVATDARYSGPAILAMARRAAMEAVPCTVCTLGVVDPDGTAHWEDLAEVEPSGWCECWEPVRA